MQRATGIFSGPISSWTGARRSPAKAVAAAAVAAFILTTPVIAQDTMESRIEALVPDLEAYIERGMTEFDNPALAVGIVTGDRLVYSKGFGVGAAGQPIDNDTVFQIGSTTKAFLATSLAIGVDREHFGWSDRVVDLYPEFQMKDGWVTQQFLVSDMLAQHSGMPQYANDGVGLLGFDQAALIHSMRFVEPVYSFRSAFSYTNVTHMLAQRLVARHFNAADWDTVVRDAIFTPLGMTNSSFTAEAIESASNTTVGHFWAPDGVTGVPFTQIFPYDFGGAGGINSTVNDLSSWVRMHLAGGVFAGDRIVSEANLSVTKTPRTAMAPNLTYAMGWVAQNTPNGRITWHNGGTTSYGSFIGTVLDRDVGIIILTNETNVGLPDAIGEWALDRLLGNPEVDHIAVRLESARAGDAAAKAPFQLPANASPSSPVAGLAGNYASPTFGDVTLAVDGGALMTELSTGAKLRFDPWSGDVFTVSLVPEGRFEAVSLNLGGLPLGFAQFLVDASGKQSSFRFTMQGDGQSFDFTRAE